MNPELQRREFGIDPKDPIPCQWAMAFAIAMLVAAVALVLVPVYWVGRAIAIPRANAKAEASPRQETTNETEK